MTGWYLASNICMSLPIGLPIKHKNLGPYLAGLIEGDGSIHVPDFNIHKNRSCVITITFTTKDLPLALYLTKIIGGKVYSTKGIYVVLRITKKQEL